MRKFILAALIVAWAAPASARPGFYIGLGFGGTAVSGESVGYDRLGFGISGIIPPTTDIAGGISGLYQMGFNILGYAAIETRLTAGGNSLFSSTERQWMGNVSLALRAYPAWHWQDQFPELLQPLEPSLFFGFGLTGGGYIPLPGADSLGWTAFPSWTFGLSVEYFVISYFKIVLEYSHISAPFDTFIFNFDDDITFGVNPVATTGFNQVVVMAAFQFGADQEAVRY